jgi:protoporphyrinogen oxidase
MRERVGVIGAGPAGLAAAYTLGRLGVPADVFEAGSDVGGMARTVALWDQLVDIGPHRFFSANGRVNRLWLGVVGGEYKMVERQTRIFYEGRFFEYPLRLTDSLAKLGPAESLLCLLSYFRQAFGRQEPAANFEAWVRGRFGQRLYEIFFRGYSEKLWGIRCDRLDADFAAQRIRKLSLYEAVRNALASGRGNRHATLVDRFAYPLGGTGSVYQRMADAIGAQDGAVHLRTSVRRVVPREDGSLEVETGSGACRSYRHVISTMPLVPLVQALPDAPPKVREACSRLRYRNTILVYLRVEAQNLFPDQWVYVNSRELAVGRITNFRNWVPELCGESRDTILSLELWCNPGDAVWRDGDERHIERASADLRRTGLIDGARIAAGHVVRVPCCYPLYEVGYRDHLDVLEEYLRTIPGLDVIGRGGSFKYNNQDHSLLMGILAAENVALDRDHDLWAVNAGDEYQEAAVIDETGLVPQLS